MTIEDLGKMYGLDYVQPGKGGDGVGPVYSNWDRSSITVCNCDAGFFGPDCSRIMCPKTDDPVTVNQNSRSIRLDIESNGAMSGDGLVSASFSESAASVEAPAGVREVVRAPAAGVGIGGGTPGGGSGVGTRVLSAVSASRVTRRAAMGRPSSVAYS